MRDILDMGLMTADEVIKSLRMEHLKDPKSGLAHLRRTRRLKSVKIGKVCHYLREDVHKLIQDSVQE